MERRFIAPIIGILIIFVVSTYMLITLMPPTQDLLLIIPGPFGNDVAFIMIVSLGSSLSMYFLGTYISSFYVNVHKALKLNRYEYFIVKPEKNISGSRIILRSFYPGLLAINIAIYLSFFPSLNNFIMADAEGQGLPVVIEMYATIIGTPIASILILPNWIVDSSGLTCSLKKEKYKNRKSEDIEGVGRDFNSLFKGYIGISTITSYILILYGFAQTDINLLSFIVIIILDPFLIILLFLPISLILEYKNETLTKKFLSKLEIKGMDITQKEILIQPITQKEVKTNGKP